MNNYRLDRKIEIKTISTVRNSVGELVSGYLLFCKRFAEVRAKAGNDKFSSGADQPEKKWIIRVRYDSKTAAITEAMIVEYLGFALRVDSVIDEFERRKWILLYCTEHGADSAGVCSG